MGKIFDSHAHYDDRQFDPDRDKLLSSFPENGVGYVINCGTDEKTSLFSSELSEKYDFIYFAAGIHPEEIGNIDESSFDNIKKLLKNKKCAAVGEIGLDYHWDDSEKEKQKEFFASQIEIASELNMPVIVHTRDAWQDTVDILKKYKPKGVLHCFTGSVEIEREILNIGMYLGFGGAVTFKNARKAVEAVRYCPDDMMLTETDCPYMSPVPNRGKRNDSTNITFVAEKMAEIKGENYDESGIIDICCENGKKLFGIK